jgi:hypothetical protein
MWGLNEINLPELQEIPYQKYSHINELNKDLLL